VLANLYGVEIARQLIEVLSEDENLAVTGFISPTTLTRSNRSEILFYVNGRPIQDPALTTALVQAYQTMLMVGRYPMAVLFISLPSHLVDVNVHPTKAEVRFSEPNEIFRGVGRAARKALLAHTPIPSLGSFQSPVSWRPQWGGGSGSQDRELDPAWEMAANGLQDRYTEPGPGEARQQPLPEVTVPLLRLVGQVATTYLVAEGPDGLYLIDQHAAHERVLFERYMRQKSASIPSQALLEPVIVELPPAAVRQIEDQLDMLKLLGFQVELFGTGMFIVRGIPSLLSGMEPAAALRVLVEDFEEDESPLAGEIEARIIARICKRAAIKAGKVLSVEEQRSLLTDLEACQSPRTCPHGRPTMIHLSVDLLERQFGRRG
jgi:DNA mismatch repair protein MutL